MRTIQTVMEQLTDTAALAREMKDTLRAIDPEYAAEEAGYLRAAAELEREIGDAIFPSAGAYLAAVEQAIIAELIYVGWLGFQLNLDCFRNPINTLFLNQDYEDLHRERRMHTLPDVQRALHTIDGFMSALPEDQRCLTEGVTGYYSYLQTTGYKLAHYFGFRLADKFLYHVVPGYTSDSVTTSQYRAALQKCLNVDLEALE